MNPRRVSQNSKATGSRSQSKSTSRKAKSSVYQLLLNETVQGAIAKLVGAFPFRYARGRALPDHVHQQVLMGERLILLALAHIDVTGPRLAAMIKYCEAEGLDQEMYLQSLVESKFKKKLQPARWM